MGPGSDIQFKVENLQCRFITANYLSLGLPFIHENRFRYDWSHLTEASLLDPRVGTKEGGKLDTYNEFSTIGAGAKRIGERKNLLSPAYAGSTGYQVPFLSPQQVHLKCIFLLRSLGFIQSTQAHQNGQHWSEVKLIEKSLLFTNIIASFPACLLLCLTILIRSRTNDLPFLLERNLRIKWLEK